jgi:hypothetical protein
MVPIWMAVPTMANAPAIQIAIVMVSAMSECGDIHVTAIAQWEGLHKMAR